MTEKKEVPADPMADKRSEFDHKEGRLSEPKIGDEPKVMRHDVDPRRDINLEEGQDVHGPVPRRGDPFAHQRDAKAAEAGNKKEAAKEEDEAAKRPSVPPMRGVQSGEAAKK